MHSNINHHNVVYNCTHLTSFTTSFKWSAKDNSIMLFHATITFSNHCYSEELKGAVLDGAASFLDHGGKIRVFHPDRHEWSKELPVIVGDIFKKPTTSLTKTTERNYYVYKPKMNHPLPNGEKYYCFINIKHNTTSADGTHNLDVMIESAYSRDYPPQTPKNGERPMLGLLAERLATKSNRGVA